MRLQNICLLVAAAGSRAARYSLNDALVTANEPFPEAFVSYSIEFSSFPDFAGNDSKPNTFSDNLLNNIGNLTGTKPYIRVGGNTQDYALYNASLPYALNGTFDYAKSSDYPTTIFIGPSYFESYAQWPGVKFSHGFNLALGGNNSAGWQTLLDTVPLACQALSNGKLNMWEYGNEPDLYSTSSQGAVRPAGWNESWYVAEWLNGTLQIRASLEESCPDLLENDTYGYFAPSFAGVNNTLKLPATWAAGLDTDEDIKLVSTHNYISGATTPGVTLQGTLLNHSVTAASVDAHIAEYDQIWANGSGVPLIFGETNSLYNEGKPGLSNTFGAALWGVDFNLYSASVGIKRVHMHMGTNYRYASWQPIETVNATIGTKPPYYGNIAVAAFLGNTLENPVSIANVPLSDNAEAAYTAYSTADSSLIRAMIINMNTYNTTVNGTGLGVAANITTRTSRIYTFDVSGGSLQPGDPVGVQRLSANGSDAISGITWDGYSYNYELDEGRPVRLENVTVGEYVVVSENSTVAVSVPDSSAAVLNFVGNVSTVINVTHSSSP
ncbi:family 79 glycoside hydrolase [Cryphonectria parasitica EP155]|uniref:Family 79 glycoside hydrolase n=1 Tax=Cryphonectria parasitica (strain ATCC 38755 / EP155) TaxID=660469 RepID=A0A9P4Y157_CRYP1|nr:family 79 glycoside hydrolase [Cryphonectria parasitica EP155]KAF3764636.1 family 79 glycoside hydrolase [Cryphonectria parasitica EP155]